ncbi:MAG: PhnD/SsuA/transferrin family substrate-binding protein [Verrucomicrobia bacterium]|nr:PhnD/SsuA/transferrin family substrate-binding protein [Verrucomicrobiota bacterium]
MLRQGLASHIVLLIAVAGLCLGGCGGGEEATLGTRKRPLEIAVPVTGGKTPLAGFIRSRTGLVCREMAAATLTDLLDEMDKEKVDVLIVPAPVYALASEPYGLLAIMKARRGGGLETRGMILVRADRGLVAVADVEDLSVAAVAPASVSGCLLQRVLVTEQRVVPSSVTYLGDEAAVVRAVYDGEADLGFVEWRLNSERRPADARELVFSEVPDIFEAVVPLAVTSAVPHAAVAVRARVPDGVRADLVEALEVFSRSSTGRTYLMDHYGIEGLVPSDDVEYAEFRTRLKAAGILLADLMEPEKEE